MSKGFIRGLTLLLCLASEHLVVVGPVFPKVVGHVRDMEKECLDSFNNSYQIGDVPLPPRLAALQ